MHQKPHDIRTVAMDAHIPETLRQNIIRSIQREEVRRMRVAFSLSFAAMLASVFGIIISIRYAMLAFYQSNFFSYASLAFSDTDVVAAYWREFAFSLLETLPLFAITFSLIAFALFLISLRMFVANAQGSVTPSLV